MHYQINFTRKGAPGVFWTEASSPRHARINFRLHYPTGRIQRLTPVKVDA